VRRARRSWLLLYSYPFSEKDIRAPQSNGRRKGKRKKGGKEKKSESILIIPTQSVKGPFLARTRRKRRKGERNLYLYSPSTISRKNSIDDAGRKGKEEKKKKEGGEEKCPCTANLRHLPAHERARKGEIKKKTVGSLLFHLSLSRRVR